MRCACDRLPWMRSVLMPASHQEVGEPVGAMLRAREDQRLRHRPARQEMDDQQRFQFLRHRIDGLRDPRRGRGLALHLNRHRIAQHLGRQRRNRRRHRRAEEERLTTRRQVRQDLANLGQEAHVEHAVRLVEDEVLELVHPGVARAHVIEQPAGRRDDDVDAAPERVLLRSHADAAEDRRAGDRRVDRERVADLRESAPPAPASAPARARASSAAACRSDGGESAAGTPPSCRCRSARSR